MEFARITILLLVENRDLLSYLDHGRIKPAARGGVYIGNRNVAPISFRQFGIVLKDGGLIIPNHTPEFIRHAIAEAAKATSRPRTTPARSTGKTARDRANGVIARHAANKAKRAEKSRNRLSAEKH